MIKQRFLNNMEFRIPVTFSGLQKLKKKSKSFLPLARKKGSNLSKYFKNIDLDLNGEEYLAICFRNSAIAFVISLIISGLILFLFKIKIFYLLAIVIGILFAIFIFSVQVNYPKVYNTRKQKNIEKNLIPALEDMLVQLNSGIPLFNILVNVSSSGYDELSEEFKKAAKKINVGVPQVEVLEELGEKNSSIFFRRTLWQLSNGMRSGSDISIIMKESI